MSVQAVDNPDKPLGSMAFQYILCVGSSKLKSIANNRLLRFQYILCVGSRWGLLALYKTVFLVSIHLMCRFKSNGLSRWCELERVSIHLMCRFKLVVVC